MAHCAVGAGDYAVERNIYGLRPGGAFGSVGIGAVVLTAGSPTPAAVSGYVLHAVPANGGGVDRYVRDICAHRAHDCILHIVREQCVFEAVAAEQLIPIDYADMAHAIATGALGRPALIHAHSTLAPVRDRVRQLCQALAIDYVVTLHDIDFAAAAVDVGDGEREARLAFVSEAAARVAPSQFIVNVLLGALGASVSGHLIENGVDASGLANTALVATESDTEKQFQIAVIGALGPHKGLSFLRDVVAALPAELRVVIVGYADGQVTPGWLQQDRLWVHGAFEPQQLATIVQRYGVGLAFFPNQQPESYCYALSDGWCAGLPALGPASGAIGDRIAGTGAGWTFDPGSTPEAVARAIVGWLASVGEKKLAVRRAVEQLLAPAVMVERLGHVYEKNMKTTHEPPQLSALNAVAATQLNGRFFRGELQRLSGDLAFSQTQIAQVNASMHSLTHEFDGRGAWIATLEKNLADTQAELRRVEAARQAEHVAAELARDDERARSNAARDQERAAAEAALHRVLADADAARAKDRAEIEAARVQDRSEIEAARATDRADIEAAREKERLDSEAARAQDRTDFAAALALARSEMDAVRADERANAEALRALANAAHASELARERALLEAQHQQQRLYDREQVLAERMRDHALSEAAQVSAHAAYEQYAAKLQKDVNDTLAIAHRYEQKIANYEHALSSLPTIVQRWMRTRGQRLAGAKDAQ